MRWLLSFIFLLATVQAKQLECTIRAEGAVLMNAKTGAILFEKNAYTPAFPASTTKIATALYALQHTKHLEKKFVATKECIASITPQAKRQSNYRSPPHWLETDGGHIGIKLGEQIPFYDLLCAMLIASANDASNVIAQNIGGSIPTFMEKVNRYLKQIGCKQTFFNNPHGLHHPDHVTTPYDLALMAKVGLENPIFKKIVKTVRYECPQTNLEYARTFLQTNLLLRNGSFAYSKAIGVKTGTTQAAGKSLVAAAEENGRCLIAALIGHRGARGELYQDVIKLFETAFHEPKMRRYLLNKGEISLTTKVSGARGKLKAVLPEGLYYDFYLSEEQNVRAHASWQIPPLPIKSGDKVGVVKVVDENGSVVSQAHLFASNALSPTLWYRLTHFDKKNLLLFLLGVCITLYLLWKIKRKTNRINRPLF